MSVVVFTGPTLPRSEVGQFCLDCQIMPPARQGDIWSAVRAHRPVAIALIDGVFFHDPAVWHREILWALAEGVHVFGAASMGALRAAELAPFGMQGVGKVFEAYRDGIWPGFPEPFEDDDEVAVIHAPAELGHAPLSDAMVDLRDTLLAASADGIITIAEARALAERLKSLPFGERSLAHIVSIGTELLGPATAERLSEWLPVCSVPRKRLDALAMLERLSNFINNRPEPFTPPFRFEVTQTWHDFVSAPIALTLEEELVLEEVRLCVEDWHDTERAGLGRLCAVNTAPASRSDDERMSLKQFRLARGLVRRADLDAWLVSNAATAGQLRQMMREEAAMTASLAVPPAGLARAVVDHLRMTDRFSALLGRAMDKRARLAGVEPPGPGPRLDAALGWFRDRAGEDGWASAPKAWADEAGFHRAVWRDYIFAQAKPS